MNIRSNRSFTGWAAALAIALGSMIIGAASVQAATLRRGSSAGSAASFNGQDTFFSGYFDFGTGSTVDNALKLENPTSISGNICAMIYVFDWREGDYWLFGTMLTA